MICDFLAYHFRNFLQDNTDISNVSSRHLIIYISHLLQVYSSLQLIWEYSKKYMSIYPSFQYTIASIITIYSKDFLFPLYLSDNKERKKEKEKNLRERKEKEKNKRNKMRKREKIKENK